MELLPIIYWSLVGFGLITLMVILTAYLTYQFRKKLGKISSKAIGNENRALNKKETEINSNTIKHHHPRVVKQIKQKNDTENSPIKHQTIKERITVLNDFALKEKFKENRFNQN